MKLVLFIVAAFAAIQSINCYVATDDSEELMHQINLKLLRERLREKAAEDVLKDKVNAICPGYGSRIRNVTEEIQSCVVLVDIEHETMCSLAHNLLPRCAAPIIELFEECLPTQSKKIPSMIQKMIVAATKHLCKSDGEHIFELANPCAKNVNLKTQRCIRRLTAKIESYERSKQYPSAQDVCETLESYRPCLQSHLNAACGHHITRDTYLGLFDELLSVCKTYELNQIEVREPTVQ